MHDQLLVILAWDLIERTDRAVGRVTLQKLHEGIDLPALEQALKASEPLRQLLLRYASSFLTQMAGTLASNLFQTVEQRTARWILMYNDRIHGDNLFITHEELGAMLGVRRASITDALHQLEGCGSIRALRGRVQIRDGAGLVGLASNSYGRAEAEYERLLALC